MSIISVLGIVEHLIYSFSQPQDSHSLNTLSYARSSLSLSSLQTRPDGSFSTIALIRLHNALLADKQMVSATSGHGNNGAFRA